MVTGSVLAASVVVTCSVIAVVDGPVVCVVDVMTVTGSVVTSVIVVACSVIAVVEGTVV